MSLVELFLSIFSIHHKGQRKRLHQKFCYTKKLSKKKKDFAEQILPLAEDFFFLFILY